MASLAESLGTQDTPALNISGDISAGLKAGIGLATAKEDVQAKQQQVEEQQNQINEGKFKAFDGMMKSLNRMTPAVAKQAAPKIKQQFQSYGFDPAIVDVTMSDPQFGRAYQNMSDAVSGALLAHPDHLAGALQNLSDAGLLDQAITGYQKTQQEQNALKKQSLENQGKIDSTNAAVQGRTDVANIKTLASPTVDRNERMEFSRITNDSKLKPLIQNHQQVTKDLNLLNSASNDPDGVPVQVLNELGSGMGTLISNAKSTGSERDAQVFGNLNTRIASLLTKASTDGVDKVNDPALFNDIRTQMTRLAESNKQNAFEQVDALRRPTKNEGLGKQQDAAIANVKKMFEPKSVGTDVSATAPVAAAPTAGDSPGLSAAVKKFLSLHPGADPTKARDELMKAGIK